MYQCSELTWLCKLCVVLKLMWCIGNMSVVSDGSIAMLSSLMLTEAVKNNHSPATAPISIVHTNQLQPQSEH